MTTGNKTLATITDGQPSGWKEKAVWRKENREWLRYSRDIALRILDRIEEIPDMNQSKLAVLTGVSKQQISKIIQGRENLTLETIAKISEVLQMDLINNSSVEVKKVEEPITNKILGLDLGTNSIGWAIREKQLPANISRVMYRRQFSRNRQRNLLPV